ncbi:MAG: MarR family transcriptional regulator [Polaromonas sp. 39-63-203]|jgi:DNA-binding MarR family transcriptional regulator|uniref:MarR family winged helix-turn-helix transcriptional regulator n=1 Tax=Polaromonas sp. TaxID=1869339 RepID=UPI000BC90191|nr:MarR family transcriptional regulator [Polaromonas sp.]OYY53291.1 MAG: MarR family transcriptional regulator [Polaromonas sp. 35-63-240]OYY95130.1 MAG: MarR family transcriptional regulator [Polaromonas sp. 28-63-22]OYZ84443.1 MAG: MarR family transcriptional regulator [Polaromonas sp. 24-62-144]OZA98127.1 MAG: MarR family transcriptional regulator [Polaromonas sp. 39-63-203]HQS30176.1 MarR family transcriptional regulator [Polaromonas sp.]
MAETISSKDASNAPDASDTSNPLLEAITCPLEFYRAEGYNPSESVGYLMRRIIALIAQDVERELEPEGLTNAQWVPLLKLHMGQASTVAELARGCDLDAGSMTRLLDRLEAKQLVRRVRSVDDRRVVNLELTEAGQVAAREIPVVLSRVQNAHLAGFSADEWQTLKGYLRRILETAQTLQAQQAQHTVNTAAARVADITPAKTSLPT